VGDPWICVIALVFAEIESASRLERTTAAREQDGDVVL